MKRLGKTCVLREIDFPSEFETVVTVDLFHMCCCTSISHPITWKVFENLAHDCLSFRQYSIMSFDGLEMMLVSNCF